MVLMTSTRRWSSTTNEDRPAACARLRPGDARSRSPAGDRTIGRTGHGCYRRPGERGVRLAGAQGDRLRAPGRRVGVAVVDPPRHRARRRGGRDRHRARRARHGGRRAGGVPRRHGRPHHGGAGHHRLLHARASCARWTSRTGGSPAPTSRRAGRRPSTPSGAGHRRTRRSASPPCARSSSDSPAWC